LAGKFEKDKDLARKLKRILKRIKRRKKKKVPGFKNPVLQAYLLTWFQVCLQIFP